MYLLNKNLKTPLYIQLYDNIKSNIEKNLLKEGDKLPSIRYLAKELDVNNITVVNAYKLLEQEGYIYSIKGSGTYVRPANYSIEMEYLGDDDLELMEGGILSIDKDNINLSSVTPSPDLFPIKEFKESIIEILDRDKALAFTYPEINGYAPLRESIVNFLEEYYNISIDKKHIQIISGGQQGIDIITKTLINPGDYVFVENPTYTGALTAFKSRGAKIIGIPINENGIDIKLLKEYIKIYNPKLLYIMTNFQSPTTFSYSEEIKNEIIKLSKENNFFIVEDDFLTDISFGKNKYPIKSLDKDGKVIYIKSFSKSFMPGIRIGFMTMTDELLPSIIRIKHSTDISSSAFMQRAFDQYLRKGYWKKYINNIKNLYNKKYNLILDSMKTLEKYDIYPSKPNGGLSLWVKLPKNIDSTELYNIANKNKLSITPGNIFFVDNTIYNNYIRISFSSTTDEEIIKGINILEQSIEELLNGSEQNYIPFI